MVDIYRRLEKRNKFWSSAIHDGLEIWGIGTSYAESDAEVLRKYELCEQGKTATVDFVDEWMSLEDIE